MTNTLQSEIPFAQRSSVEQVEESDQLAPKFDDNGCMPCITKHAETGEVLMFAFMNAKALRNSISSGLAHYWSDARSFGKKAKLQACSNRFSAFSSMTTRIALS